MADEDTNSIPVYEVDRVVLDDARAPPGNQICNHFKWRHLVANITDNRSEVHLVGKFATNIVQPLQVGSL